MPGISHLNRRWLGRQTFRYENDEFHYFCHPYNIAWRNERAVEIPVFRKHLEEAQQRGGHILEVGNVTSHYFQTSHDIVDKYETTPKTLNVDIADFEPSHPYDLIISISTLEHIGFDEVESGSGKVLSEADPHKSRTVAERLRQLLAPHGLLVISVPRGYNAVLDRQVDEGSLPFEHYVFMRRKDWANRWEQCSAEKIKPIAYGRPYPGANGVVFGYACGRQV
ncbi:MAG: hypothetical protein U9Q79_06135 [Candidatus Hydrogenedentes bacterium]|nr:hypothetical protein [Candidatus Hydrogenedentota bacterium]